MTSSKMTNDDMLALETSYMELTTRCIDGGVSPYACAAIMTKVAFMIYKSSLDPEEYNVMIDSISDSRNKIPSFDKMNRLN